MSPSTSAAQRVGGRIQSLTKGFKESTKGLNRHSGTLLSIWDRIIGNSDRLQAQVDRVNESINRVAGSLGDAMVPAFRTVADLVAGAADTFTELPGPLRAFIAMALGVATALSVVAPAAAAATAAIGSISVPILALIAIVAALYAVWTSNLFGIQQIAAQVLGGIRKLFAKVVGFVRPLWKRFVAGLKKLWGVHGKSMGESAGRTIRVLTKAFKQFVAVTEPLWKNYLKALAAQFKIAFAVVKAVVLTQLDFVLTFVRVFLALLRGDLGRAKEILFGFVDRTVDRIVRLAERVKTILGNLAKPAVEWATSMLKKFIEGIVAKKEALQSKVDEVKQAITDALTGLADSALGWGKDVVEQLARGIKQAADAAKQAATDVVADVESAIGFDVPANDRMARRWGSDLVAEFATGMQRNRRTLRRTVPAGDPGTFGLAPPGSAGGAGTTVDVTVEAGAVQLAGGGTARVNADRTADGIAREFEDRFGRLS